MSNRFTVTDCSLEARKAGKCLNKETCFTCISGKRGQHNFFHYFIPGVKVQDTKSVDVHASSKSTLNLSIEGYGVPALLFSKNSYLTVFWGLSPHISG